MGLPRCRRIGGGTFALFVLAWLFTPARASAQAGVAVGVFGTPFEDGLLQTDWGVKGIVTASTGTGGEVRWAKAADEKLWSAGLFQTVSAVRGAKTFQPFASIGAFRVENATEHAAGMAIAGGVAVFIGHLGIDADFRYFLGFQQFAGQDIRDRHVSLGLLWRF
jgi:hypothetical protein